MELWGARLEGLVGAPNPNVEQGIMSEIEWKLYQDWFSWMIPKVNSEKHGENMTIYLQSNPETCYKRIKERARPEEKSVTLPYLRNIHTQHEQWLSNETDSVKIIDANGNAILLCFSIL